MLGRSSDDREKTTSLSTIEHALSSPIDPHPDLTPEDEPKYSVFKNPRAWWRQNYLSWRFYVFIYACLALLATLVIAIALLSAVRLHGVDKQGRINLFEGSCSKAKKSSFFAHAFISAIGTYMLSASAYVIYCLHPPSREEIDREHAKGRFLDIGVMSFRNLRVISRKRVMFIVLLGITSPICQFFFNAFLFQTYSANAYTAYAAQETFVTKPNISVVFPNNDQNDPLGNHTVGDSIKWLHYQFLQGRLQKLNNRDCINAYAVPVLSERRNVILITENDPTRPADVFDAYDAAVPTESNKAGPEQFSWVCDKLKISNSDQCLFHIEHLKKNSTSWTTSNGAVVKYCLSQPVREHCKLQFNVALCCVVLFTCLFKTMVMYAVAFCVEESPLMTTGDAIASFMARPDQYTQKMCLASKKFIQNHPGHWRSPAPAFFDPTIKRWNAGVKSRLYVCLLLMVIGTCFSASLYCTLQETITFKNLIHLGMGSINRRFFVGWHRKDTSGMMKSVIFANEGHALFGILYIIYNNVFYAMLFQTEWARFFNHRKGLRVSQSPRGKQRTVYFFMMPYSHAIPIMAFSCVIHTLISQTVFLVDVEAWGITNAIDSAVAKASGYFTRNSQYDFTTTGFSPLADIALILMSLAMIAYLICMSLIKLKSAMPIVSTCSAAIAAACHPDENEEPQCWLKPMQWGVTSVVDGIGHCTFSAKEVSEPDYKTPYM